MFDDSEVAILTLSEFDFERYVDTRVSRWIRDQYWMRVITSRAAKKQQVYKPVMTPDGEQPVYFDGYSSDLTVAMLSMNLNDGNHRKSKAALDHDVNIVDVPEFRISRTYALGCAAEDMRPIVNDEIDERLERMRVEVDRTVALVNSEVPALSDLKTDARPANSAGGSSGNTQGSFSLEQLRDEAASRASVVGPSTSSIVPTMAHITDGMEGMDIAG